MDLMGKYLLERRVRYFESENPASKMFLKERRLRDLILRYYFPSFPQDKFIKVLPDIFICSFPDPYSICSGFHDKII